MKKVIMSLSMALVLTFATYGTAQAMIFFDDFSVDPTTGGWSIVGDVTQVNHFEHVSPVGSPVARINAVDVGVASIERTVSTSGYTDIELSYYLDTHSIRRGDSFDVSWRITGATDWTSLASKTTTGPWAFSSFLFGSSAEDASVDIRFLANNVTGNRATGYLDNVNLTGSNIVPEPATMLLFGSGMIGMAFRRRKKA